MAKVTAYLIAFNEEAKIGPALESVAWADEVIVADSHSTDRTAEIAEGHGARVVQIRFVGFGALRNEALKHCSHEWIFSLDSDERCTAEVRDEIRAVIAEPDALDAYRVPRRNWFMGRWIKHSGWRVDYRQPQLFRKGKLTYTLDPVHEGYRLDGRLGTLRNSIWQYPFQDLSQIQHKANRYSTLGAVKLQERGKHGSMLSAVARAQWAFFKTYVIQGGFRDGWAGFVIAFYNAEYTFYKHAKLTCSQRGWNTEWVPPPGES